MKNACMHLQPAVAAFWPRVLCTGPADQVSVQYFQIEESFSRKKPLKRLYLFDSWLSCNLCSENILWYSNGSANWFKVLLHFFCCHPVADATHYDVLPMPYIEVIQHLEDQLPKIGHILKLSNCLKWFKLCFKWYMLIRDVNREFGGR